MPPQVKVNICLNDLHLWVLAVSCLVVVKLLTREGSSRNYSELFVMLLVINLNHPHAQLPPTNDHKATRTHALAVIIKLSVKVQYLKQLTICNDNPLVKKHHFQFIFFFRSTNDDKSLLAV